MTSGGDGDDDGRKKRSQQAEADQYRRKYEMMESMEKAVSQQISAAGYKSSWWYPAQILAVQTFPRNEFQLLSGERETAAPNHHSAEQSTTVSFSNEYCRRFTNCENEGSAASAAPAM